MKLRYRYWIRFSRGDTWYETRNVDARDEPEAMEKARAWVRENVKIAHTTAVVVMVVTETEYRRNQLFYDSLHVPTHDV